VARRVALLPDIPIDEVVPAFLLGATVLVATVTILLVTVVADFALGEVEDAVTTTLGAHAVGRTPVSILVITVVTDFAGLFVQFAVSAAYWFVFALPGATVAVVLVAVVTLFTFVQLQFAVAAIGRHCIAVVGAAVIVDGVAVVTLLFRVDYPVATEVPGTVKEADQGDIGGVALFHRLHRPVTATGGLQFTIPRAAVSIVPIAIVTFLTAVNDAVAAQSLLALRKAEVVDAGRVA